MKAAKRQHSSCKLAADLHEGASSEGLQRPPHEASQESDEKEGQAGQEGHHPQHRRQGVTQETPKQGVNKGANPAGTVPPGRSGSGLARQAALER